MFAGPWYAFEVSPSSSNGGFFFVCSGVDRDEIEAKARKKAEESPGKTYLVLKLASYAKAGVPPVEFSRMNEDGKPVVGLDKVIVPEAVTESSRQMHEIVDHKRSSALPGLAEALASYIEQSVGEAMKRGRIP